MMPQPSENMKNRVFELIARKKAGGLSAEESAKLEKHLQLEHKMRLAKAREKRLSLLHDRTTEQAQHDNASLAPRLVEPFEPINRDKLYD